jgi:hypothetical protein
VNEAGFGGSRNWRNRKPFNLETAVGWALSGYLIVSTEVFRELTNYGAVGQNQKFLHLFNRIPFQLRLLGLMVSDLKPAPTREERVPRRAAKIRCVRDARL